MKKITLISLILFTAISLKAQVPAGTDGIGAKFGSYFGGTYKNYITSSSAVEGIVAFDWDFNTLGLIANYHIIQTDLYQDWQGLDWYAGLGGQFWIGDNTTIGPSGTAGLEYTFEDAPFSIFGDFTLYLGIGDDSGFQPQFGLGARKNF